MIGKAVANASLTAFVLLGCVCPAAAQTVAPPTKIDPTAVERTVEIYLGRNGVPGAIAVITDGSRVVYSGGFGVDSRGRTLSAQSRLPICSVSKSFTAAAVLQLVEAGKIALDTPVVRYLPEFHLADPRFAQITVRQLLMHRSGMSDRSFREKSVVPVPQTLREAVAALREARLAFAPGEHRSYHNPNYWVLARLVEVVGGQPYGAYVRDHIFMPLGMTHSSTWAKTGDAPDVAHGYIRILNQPIAAREPAWFLDGSCSVVTTASDLGNWLAMHVTGTSPATGKRILSPASLAATHDGLGWNSSVDNGHRFITHNGIMFTFTARQILLPDVGQGVGIAVATNTGIGLTPSAADEISDLLVDLVEGEPVVQPPQIGLWVDVLMIVLALAVAVIGVLLARRERRKASEPRRPWRMAVGLAVCMVPILCLARYDAVLRALLGRDANWQQILYATPTLFLLVAVAALAAAVIGALRIAALTRSLKPKS